MPKGVNEKVWQEAREAAGDEPAPMSTPAAQKKYWGAVWKIYKAKAKKRGIPYQKKRSDLASRLMAISNKLDGVSLTKEASTVDMVIFALANLE
jgi:hypothetical protein